MPSNYLSGGDLAAYGVPTATAPQIQQASAIIDAFLSRPEGLVYTPDAAGNPVYMTGLAPLASLASVGAIAPGTNVPVAVTGPIAGVTVGKALVLDKANANVLEASYVIAINGNQVTLNQVAYSHSASCTMDLGLVITERRSMPRQRPLTTLSRPPIMRILSGRGRYGYGRRGNQNEYNVNDFNMLATIQQFGGPPMWELFDITHTDFDPMTGNVWIPAGIMLAYYTEVELSYVAGFTAAALPADIKQACANIVSAIVNMPMNGNIMQQAAGDTSFRRFEASYLDTDTKALLMPFRARAFG